MSLSNGPGSSSSSGSASSFKNRNTNSNKHDRHRQALQGNNSRHHHRSGSRERRRNPRPDDAESEIIQRVSTPDRDHRSGGMDNPSYDNYGDTEYRPTNRYPNKNLPMPNGHISSTPRAKVKYKSKGKKAPLTPTPLPQTNSYNIPYDVDDHSSPGVPKTGNGKYKQNRLSDNPDDLDLVDYDDFGSTSSTSSGNSSEDEEESDVNSQIENYPRSNNKNGRHVTNHSSSRNVVDYSKVNGSWDRRSSQYERSSGGLWENSVENGPCSSSSLREPLNGTVGISKESTKVSPMGSSTTSTSKRNGSDKTTSLRKSESRSSEIVGDGGGEGVEIKPANGEFGELYSEFNPTNPVYAYSGVGRHFGRKSTTSLMDLTDEVPSTEAPAEFHGIDVLGYLTRLKAVSIVFLATLFILSSSSLLFVFPIVVDPILLGMEAQFSVQPVQCRTTNLRNGTGASECVVPSCREGCTADLFSCFFIDVEYNIGPHLVTAESYEYLNINETTNSSTFNNMSFNGSKNGLYSQDKSRNGILLININGCGFPPHVNCSEFQKTYGKLNKVFPCFYSQVNESIVVPYYNYQEEKTYLIIGLCVPIGLAIFSAIALVLLIKCRALVRFRPLPKTSSSSKLLDSSGDVKLNGISKTSTLPQLNGSVPKANGHVIQDTMAELMGMKSKEKIKESIKGLPHQHDSFDKSTPYLNGSVPVSMSRPRKSRYAKNKKFLTRGQSVDDSKLSNNRNNDSSEDAM